ncbi:uncharacterized protein LOC103496507 isoform X1 [Cucumis melo]|uniref:Uncharacterized protein LOC103496507 isoform X1 n=1 Tax=Cucumis melo TaxID=3656 RepID=A0ABM3KLZ4_CUCME|nr:uncharacterized protein LOC103496507 isoform X1 [Cucumis melo]
MPLKSGTSQKYYYCITVLMLIFFLLFELNCGNFRISILVARFQLVAEDSCCLPLLLVTVQSLFKQVVQLLFILWSGAIGLRSMIPVSFSQFRYFSCGFYYELPSLSMGLPVILNNNYIPYHNRNRIFFYMNLCFSLRQVHICLKSCGAAS